MVRLGWSYEFVLILLAWQNMNTTTKDASWVRLVFTRMAGYEYKIKGCTFTGVMAQQQRIRLGWSLCTLYLLAWQDINTTAKDASWVEFMYLVFTRKAGHKYNSKGCVLGGVYVPCIYSHGRT